MFFLSKKRRKKWVFHLILWKNQVETHSKMAVTLEQYKLKIWALRSFVDLWLPVLMHSWKSKIHCSDRTRYIDFERSRLKTLKKNCRESLKYMLRCVFISSFQRWKPQISIWFLLKVIQKIFRALLFWNG